MKSSIIISLLFFASSLLSCKKYLDAKSDKKLVVPVSLQDAQALLDSYDRLNNFYPNNGSVSDDDYYISDVYYNSTATYLQDMYIWKKELVTDNDWSAMYTNILYVNLALETINNISPTGNTQAEWQRLKGSALFFRGYANYHLAQYFAEQYEKGTAVSKPGIPLRLRSDATIPVVRNTMEETYKQILNDLTQASILLPVTVSPLSRPSRAAAFGAVARVYLCMQDYDAAGKYADSALQLNNVLLNYNSLDPNAAGPFSRFNTEVIFPSTVVVENTLGVNNWRADSNLYQSYNINDLRKKLFFKTNGTGTALYYGFKGSYDGTTSGNVFNGITVDEMLVTRAECYARAGNITAAMNDLNNLLVTRWKTGTFVPLMAVSADDALVKILTERRKELVGRGLRWFDLRRLNTDGRFAKTLTRIVNGNLYQLPPKDPRYTFYIPFAVVATSGIEQNTR